MKSLKVTDGYKVYHIEQYPQQVSSMYGNLTARGDKHFQRVFTGNDIFGESNNKYVAFGMQQAIKEITRNFNETFFSIEADKAVADMVLTLKNYIGAEQIIVDALYKLHKVGHLPITIKTVNEGDFINMNSPCMTVETDDGFAWLMGYLEPIITNMTWKSITNATTALEYFKIAKHYGDLTGTNEIAMKFGFHDFSSRGMSGMEDATRSGVPHLLFFSGTESIGALDYIEENYDYDYETEGALAGSIRATEHSVSTTNIFYNIEKMGIQNDPDRLKLGEEEFFRRYITQVYPNGIIAYVADSFDFYGFLYDILPNFKKEIEARDGKVVIRPDSFDCPVKGVLGDRETPFFLTMDEARDYASKTIKEGIRTNGSLSKPVKVRVMDIYVTFSLTKSHTFIDKMKGIKFEDNIGYEYTDATPEETGAIVKLMEIFGYTLNEKGYAELNPKIGLIYGDGFTLPRTNQLFKGLRLMGIATSNIVIGVGAGSYQWNSRDTLGIAYKATSFSYYSPEGKKMDVDVYKDPKGSDKKSAKGLFEAKYVDGVWDIKDSVKRSEMESDDMKVLYEDGKLNEVKFSEIRNNIDKNINTFLI